MPEPKVALVTGASRGIGRAIALRLAGDGALVAVHFAHHAKAAAETVAEIEARGGQAFAVRADLSTLDGVRALFAATDRTLRKLTGAREFDVLVNNAGISQGGALEETTEAEFDELIAVNVKAPFFIVREALPRLRDGGRVVNVSSGTSLFAYPDELAYSMTKGSINVMTRALAKQLGPRGITVNAVAPGIIDTDFHGGWLRDPQAREFAASLSPLGRVGEPADIADVVAFLVSDDARWVTGALLDATGGALLG